MSSSINKCWTDTSVLPSNILSLQGYDFFKIVENLTSDTVADLLRIQAIRNVQIFMLVPDLLVILKVDSSELDHIKSKVCVRMGNNQYFCKPGVRASLQYLHDLFATKIREYYYPNDKQQTDVDKSISPDDSVTSGQKRPASSSEHIPTKRGRK